MPNPLRTPALLCSVLTFTLLHCSADGRLNVVVAGDGSSGMMIADTFVAVDVPDPTDTFTPRPDVPSPARCRSNMQCDDLVNCTIDECNFADGTCSHRVDIDRCECDPACHSVQVGGAGGRPFDPAGRHDVEYDMDLNGLLVRANPFAADFLWVPNTGESTISKWDAVTEREIARYRTGLPSGECRGQCCVSFRCNMVSRVVVDGGGNVYASNRGFGMQGSVNKIAALREDCVDRNMNGVIDTSSGPMDVLPYGADECNLWTAEVGPVDAVLRSITIDRGDERFPEGYVWVGGCANTGGLQGGAGLFQLNPRTGATLRHVDFEPCAYGGVVTTDGTLWQHTLSQGITPVDPVTGRVGALLRSGEGVNGNGGTYGITADASGRVWVSRAGQDAFGYDPRLRQWTWANVRSLPGAATTGLGITVDPHNHVWIAGPTVAFEWDANAFVGNREINPRDIVVHRLPAIPMFASVSAIGADRRGRIWLATSQPGPLVRYDPSDHSTAAFSGPNQVYTYSDFTGAVRRLVIGTGSHTEIFNTGCDPLYDQFSYSATTPVGTSLQFVFRTALSQAGLSRATAVVIGIAPRDRNPIDIAARLLEAGVAPGPWASVTVDFSPSNVPVQSPVLQSIGLRWRCADR